MADYQVTVGDVEIISISDGTNEFPAAHVFPGVTAAEWERYPGTVSSEGKLKTNFGCFIIRSEGQTILVDTGIGPGLPGRLLDELRTKGVDLNEIAVVAITHLHPDHVGWSVSEEGGKERPTFSKARYRVPKIDWDHFRQPQVLEQAVHMKNKVLPLEESGVLDLMEGETAITGEVTMLPTPGHTPGHMSVAILSQGQRGFIMGDVTNFPFQAQETAWELLFDYDKELARRTREAVLERLEREGSIVGAGHFLPPSLGRFVRTEGRRYWQGL